MKNALFTKFIALIAFTFVFALGNAAYAQTTAFTFQGKLNDGAVAANGTYQFQFKLYNAASGGNQIGSAIADLPATVTSGIFAVSLDFGAASFDGAARYLEIGVRLNGSGQPYTILNPRQAVTSTPYAIKSLNANQANTANLANDATSLGGVPAAQYTKNDDPRLNNAREPLAGSESYIRNSQLIQPNATAIIGGTLGGNTIISNTDYKIGNERVLSIGGTQNLFVGAKAGSVNTGSANTFVGSEAGNKNAGANNSFFGSRSGFSNTDGAGNSFFGVSSGESNMNGANNVFLGLNSGKTNTTGSGNVAIGKDAGLRNNTGNNNIYVGNMSGFAASPITGSRNIVIGFNASVAPNVSSAVAIGDQSAASADYMVAIGSNLSTVRISGKLDVMDRAEFDGVVRLASLGVPGSNPKPLCLGAGNLIAACSVASANLTKESSEMSKIQQAQIDAQAEQIKHQQAQIDALKAIVCAANKSEAVCQTDKRRQK
jgi:hypothetical protein